jgi:hypothetical protein
VVADFLAGESDPNLRVLVVWEPILPADWRAPGRSVLARIPDPRARQFWDPQHFVALEIARRAATAGKSPPACCFNNGFQWDEALLYAPGASWQSAPAAVYWAGPVWKSINGLKPALTAPDPRPRMNRVSASATPAS